MSTTTDAIIPQSLGFFALVLKIVRNLFLSLLQTGPIPRHVALIMDGNRRYARINKLEIEGGHSAGAQSLIEV